MGIWTAFLFTSILSSLAPSIALAASWDGTVLVNNVSVPFRIDIEGNRGWFWNGDERVLSTAGVWEGNRLTLRFAQYGSVLKASLEDGVLNGTYDRDKRGVYPFRAVPAKAIFGEPNAPSIAGVWELPVKSPKGELAWRFVVRQNGAAVSGAILRIDGDTGTLTGTYWEGAFRLSHFSGARPLVVEARPQPDGSLEIVLNGKDTYRAERTEKARAENRPAPAESFHHTSFTDTQEPFRFAFPDLAGRLVRNTDREFQGKVLLVAVSGSWCPNCHDEAPYLQSLYRKYKAEGLEVVALSFEEAEQLAKPERLRAFVKEYGLEYTVLLAGEPDELQAKLPQARNLNSWPTTVFLGRDGRVRGVHAGFSSHATGSFYDEQAVEMEGLIQRLLKEHLESSR